MKRLFWLSILITILGMLVAGVGAAASTPAGTRIYNKAVATYKYGTLTYTVESNLVYTDVQPVYGLTITPDGTQSSPGQQQTATAGATVYFPYLLTNTGNADDSYDLTCAIDGNSTFPPTNIKIYLDTNGNGAVDSGEPAITNTGTVHPDQTIHLIVSYYVPVATAVGKFALVNLIGKSTHDSSKVDDNNWNKTTVTSDAVLTITKLANVTSVNPGGTIQYTISGKNTGNNATTPRTFTNIDTDGDGSADAAQGILIEDPIPEHTHVTGNAAEDFVDIAPPNAIPLYHYDSTNLWSKSGTLSGKGNIDKVGLFIPGSLEPGLSYKFIWNAVVDSNAPAGDIRNTATLKWRDATGNHDTDSNTALTTVNAIPGVQIGPKGDPAGTGTGSYPSPDPINGPNIITYDNDTSTAAFAVCGAGDGSQTIVFTNTIKNTGTSTDTFNVVASWSKNKIPGAVVRLFKSDGLTPLTDTNGDGIYDIGNLPPNATYNIVVKVIMPTRPACDDLDHDITITVLSVNDPNIRNTTTDRIRFGANIWDPLKKEVHPSGDVPPGIVLHFTSTFGNNGTVNATDVELTDVLDVHLKDPRNITGIPPTTIPDISGHNLGPISVNATYTPDPSGKTGGTITWHFPVVPAGFIGQVSFDVTVDPTTPDATVINNTVSITGKGLPTKQSNVTVNTVVSKNVLIVEKQVNKNKVEIGDYLKYTIVAKNISKTMTISAPVKIVDTLPRGFRYVKGTSRLDGKPISDPVISSDGKILTWPDIGSIAPNSQKQLTYVAIVAADADKGDGINRVRAVGHSPSGRPINSNEAQVGVKVDKGVFRDCQMIIGKVFIDENDNRIQDKGEIGVPGIRLYLEDGTFTVTDSEGKYHFECVKPGDHVIKVDKISLPEGMEVDGVNNRAMGDTDSQFVDLKMGGLYKADFRVIPKGMERETVRILIMPKTKKKAQAWKEIKVVCYFKTNSAKLSPLSKSVIDGALKGIKPEDIAKIKVSVEGYADIRPTRKWKGGNLELSLARAKSVADYLRQKYRIKKENIEIKGYGATEPLVRPKILTDEALQPDRRAEIHIDVPITAMASAESKAVYGKKITVKIKKGMVGPLHNVYLVVPAEIKAGSLKINGKPAPSPIKFGGFSWLRLKAMDRTFNAKSFDNDRQKIKVKKYEQKEVVNVNYIAKAKEIPSHFIVGIDKRGDVKVVAEKPKEKEVTRLKDQIKALYIKMHPDLSVKKASAGVQKEFGILSPKDKSAFLIRDKITVRVRFPLNARPELKVNGMPISQKTVGKKAFDMKNRRVIYEYVGVPLKPGKNDIEFTYNLNGQKKTDHITVFRANKPVKIEIKTYPHQLSADGKTEPVVIIKPVDKNGLPLPDGTFITLDMDKGRFVTPDANPQQEGYQARIENGVAKVRISAAHKTEERTLKVIAGKLQKEEKLEFLPYLRDWIIVGIGSGTIGHNHIKKSAHGDKTDDEDGLFVDGRLAFFAKGTILGKYLLTAAYDTDKSRDRDKLFRMIAPDKYYPVYGDSSIQRYDAESSKKLYVKIARNKSYVMYGDFKTEFTDNAETARYDRTFTGAKANIETKYLDVKAFWSRTDQTIVKDEIRGDGTSGYYHLTHGHMVENSDKVRIEVRDRYDPSRVISSRELSRYTDYWIDYDRGEILFKEPINSVDDEFNPVYIVVTYETREGAKENDIYGGRLKLKLFNDKLEIGSTGVLEKNSIHDNKLYGTDVKWRLNKHIEARGELTKSNVYDRETFDVKTGTSRLASLKLDYGKNLKGEVKYLKTDKDFRNPSMSSFSGAVEEYSLNGESKYFKNTDLKLDALRRKNLNTGERLKTVGLEGKVKLTDKVTGILGGRYANLHTSSINQDAVLTKAGLIARLTKKLKASILREQVVAGDRVDAHGFASTSSSFDTLTSTGSNAAAGSQGYLESGANILGDGYSDRTVAGLQYQLTDKTQLRATHEWLSGRHITVRRTLFGATSQLSKNISVFGNYGIEDSVDNPRSVANIGIKNKIDITDKLSADIGLERLQTVKGNGDDDFTAFTSSFSYLPDLYKITGRYELRFGETDTRHLLELVITRKMNTDYTLFARDRFSYTNNHDKQNEYENELLVGLAYRPIYTDKLNFLSMLRLWNEKEENGDKNIKLIGSFEANYQPIQSLTLSGKYALKWQNDHIDDKSYYSFTDLIEGRVIYDITDRWDCGIHGGVLHQYDTKTFDYYAGVEIGYRLVKNLWLSLGYNLKGLKDRDFGDADYYTDGPYITLRFKFDEDTLGLGKSRNKGSE